jgi:hypothetical protein
MGSGAMMATNPKMISITPETSINPRSISPP